MADTVPAKLRFKRSFESACPMSPAKPSKRKRDLAQKRVTLKLKGVALSNAGHEAGGILGIRRPSIEHQERVAATLSIRRPSIEQQERVAATLSMAPAEVIAWFRGHLPKLQAMLVNNAHFRQKVKEGGGLARLDAKTVAAAVRRVRMAQMAPPTSNARPVSGVA